MISESWVCLPDGRTVPFRSLTAEEKKLITERISRNLAETIGRVWQNYPADRSVLEECILKSGA